MAVTLTVFDILSFWRLLCDTKSLLLIESLIQIEQTNKFQVNAYCHPQSTLHLTAQLSPSILRQALIVYLWGPYVTCQRVTWTQTELANFVVVFFLITWSGRKDSGKPSFWRWWQVKCFGSSGTRKAPKATASVIYRLIKHVWGLLAMWGYLTMGVGGTN